MYASDTNLFDDNTRTDAYFNLLGNANLAALGIGRVVGAGVDVQF